MRISNILGALVAFLCAVVVDVTILTRLFDWISAKTSGEIMLALQIALITIMVLITLGIPAMIASQDKIEETL